MRRQWRIGAHGRDLRLLRSIDVKPSERAALIPATTLYRLLRSWLATVELSKRKAFLRNILGEVSGPLPRAERTPYEWFLACAERKIMAGLLVAIPVPRPTGYGLLKAGAEPVVLSPVEPVKEEPPDELTWIEIELVDTNGEPVPNEPYSLTLPDGVVRPGRLNGKGLVRITGIPAGNCEVTFPGLDGREWKPA